MWLSDELSEFHPIIGKRLIPRTHCVLNHPEWGDYLVQANDQGFRCNSDFLPAIQPGFSRLLLFGDSNAFGDGVSLEVSFAGILEKLIPGLEIYNFSMAGFAVDQQFLCYQEFGRKVEHDLIMISPTIETIRKLTAHFILAHDEDRQLRCLEKPYFDLLDGKLMRGHVPLREGYVDVASLPIADREKIYRANPFANARKMLDSTSSSGRPRKRLHLMDRLNFLLKRLKVQDAITKVRPYPEYDTADTPASRIMRAILMEWAACSSKPLLLVPLPSFIFVKERADATNYQRRFQEIRQESACNLYDPLPDLYKLSLEERRELYYLEGHLTPQGHAWLAKKLAPQIKRLLKRQNQPRRDGSQTGFLGG